MYCYVLLCTHVVLDKFCDVQANSKQSTGCVRLDINLLKPSRIVFPAQDFAPHLALPHGHPSPSCSSPDWLEYAFWSSHPVLRWLPMKLAEWIGENLQEALGFPDRAGRFRTVMNRNKEVYYSMYRYVPVHILVYTGL
jgi:hypothetical protein